jgi:hypothetical protein
MAMKVFRMVLVAVAVVTSALSAVAADLPLQEPKPDQDFEDCAFVTNDCESCVVDADGKPACSSSGIACVVKERSCLIKKK